MAAMFWVNQHTTGSPFLFGYEVLWGKEHALGFHRAPWGPVHTPVAGLELVNIYLLRLQVYFLESPIPALLPAVIALLLAPRVGPADRYLLAASALLLAFYFAYWHNGFYLGPRFVFPLMPVLALWTARLPALVRERFGNGELYRGTACAMALTLLMSLTLGVPGRVREYANGLLSMRWDPDRAAKAAHVRDALVLVRESWGSQVMARLWGLGVSRPMAELLYRGVDTCVLEQATARLEAAPGPRGDGATAELLPLLRDSARAELTKYSADPTERVVLGTPYPPLCVQRIREDNTGFTLYPTVLLAREGNNVYARDLHAADTILLVRFPDRPVYLLKPDTIRVGAAPRFVPLSRDSLLAAWRSGGR